MITVTTQTEFKNAITALEPEIYVANNISLTSQTSIGYAVTITGAPDVSLFWATPTPTRNMLLVTADGDLVIESLILDAEGRNGTLVQVNGGRFTMNGNSILRNIYGRTSQSAVSVGGMSSTAGGTFIMNGGLITGIDSADAVFCSGGTVIMNNDAAIADNPSAGLSMANATGLRASLTMTGRSRIANNQSRQSGSAGIILDGDVIMGVNEGDAPSVTGNQAPTFSTGGFMIGSNSTLTMRYGAEISDNYGAQYCGGLLMQGQSTLSMHGNAAIKNNRSDGPGGGMLLLTGSTATMEDQAQITGNSSAGYCGGIILQSGSSLQMTGSSAVHSNTAVGNGAGMHIYQSTVSVGVNNSSPRIYGNQSGGRGGGVFISTGGRLDLTGRANISDNTAMEGKGIYKLGELNLSESPRILDGLFFDDLDTGNFGAVRQKSAAVTMQVPLDSPESISIELPFSGDAPESDYVGGKGIQAFAGALSPSYTDNVPVIVDTLTNVAGIQLEASNYVSPPNVALVIADKGPDYAQLLETDRAAWRIPATFGPEHSVILNADVNQVLIDLKVYTIIYENLYGSSHANPLSYTAADLPVTLSDPDERAGYLFAGWFDAEGRRVTEISAGTTGNITLTAKWEEHLLSFDGNDPHARNVPPPIHVEHGKDVQIPSAIPCRPCHCFVCWNMPSSGSGKVYFPGDRIPIGTESMTLYAQWQSVCCGCHDDKDKAPRPERFGASWFEKK